MNINVLLAAASAALALGFAGQALSKSIELPADDADMPAIVDYLAKTYGNEQPK